MVWVTITEVTGDADDGDPSVGQSPGRSVEDVKYNVQIIIDDEESPDGTKVVSTSEECLHPATREAIQTQLDTIVDSNLDDWMPDRWDDGSDDYYIDRDR